MHLPRLTSGNWLFWGMIAWIGFIFIWIGFSLDRFAPVWVGAIIGFFIFFVLFRKGPRPKEEEEEE